VFEEIIRWSGGDPFFRCLELVFYVAISNVARAEVKVSRKGPECRSGKRIIAGTAFRLEFLVGWYYDADATMAVPELY